MLTELETVYEQLEQVFAAVRHALAEIPDDRLNWQPAPDGASAGTLVQHVCRANRTYSHIMEFGDARDRPPYRESPSRDDLEAALASCLEHVRGVFERMTPERLDTAVADEWDPIEAPIMGPLSARWFAYTMLTHSAYHVGQMNTLALLLEGAAEEG